MVVFKLFALGLSFSLSCAVAWAGSLFYRTARFYHGLKGGQFHWRGQMHRPDAELGFATAPHARGAIVLPGGPEVPARHDRSGFRVPLADEAAPANSRPVILALGCSFTYGYGVGAEEAYPYLVGQQLGGTVRNAGVSGQGLAHMLAHAKRTVPAERPDYLLVQYSPWLAERGASAFAPTYRGALPVPFFYESGGEVALHPPVFATRLAGVVTDPYLNSPPGVADFLSFFWESGLPLLAHDDFNLALYHAKMLAGVIPRPTSDLAKVERHVYREIARTARENNARMVVVVLGRDAEPVRVVEGILPPEVTVVNAHEALRSLLPTASLESFQSRYGHWHGSPPRLVDSHPNTLAHRIIAETIVRELGPAAAAPAAARR
jgi:hypothetical protein